MEALIEYKLDKDLSSNKKEYFFTFLNNRFDLVNKHLIYLLRKKYNKKFEPIYILSAEPGKQYQKKNYIIINKELKKLREKEKNQKLIILQDFEELNIEFSKSEFVKNLIDKITRKQEMIFLISFTSFGLNTSNKKIVNIGPDTKVTEKYDSKIEQIKLFKKLKLPANKTKIYADIEELKNAKIDYPKFISPTYTSGGTENAIVFSDKDLKKFFSKLRKINKEKEFFIADYIKNIYSSPNSIGMVCGKNDARVLCLTDQLVRGVKHTGNIYPSKASESHKKEIVVITKKIGDYLSNLGFRGMYGCDFVIDKKDKLFVVELNPRRQSSYLILQLMSKKINLLEIELKLALGEKIPEFGYEDIQVDYVWLHNKLKQYSQYKEIKKEFKINNEETPFNRRGGEFISSYFPKEYILKNCNFFGYYIASGTDYDVLLKKSQKEIEKYF